jgi:hypothetical protein
VDTTERGDRGWKEAQRQGEDRVTFTGNSIVQPNFDILKEVYILQTNFWHKKLTSYNPIFDILFPECSKQETAQDRRLFHIQSMKKIQGQKNKERKRDEWY